METERFFSGYCRQIDGARVVEAVLCSGAITEVDCCYGSCIYQAGCPVAQEMDRACQEEEA